MRFHQTTGKMGGIRVRGNIISRCRNNSQTLDKNIFAVKTDNSHSCLRMDCDILQLRLHTPVNQDCRTEMEGMQHTGICSQQFCRYLVMETNPVAPQQLTFWEVDGIGVHPVLLFVPNSHASERNLLRNGSFACKLHVKTIWLHGNDFPGGERLPLVINGQPLNFYASTVLYAERLHPAFTQQGGSFCRESQICSPTQIKPFGLRVIRSEDDRLWICPKLSCQHIFLQTHGGIVF